MFRGSNFLVFFIIIFAVWLRFLYFPNNIYFGFDQARDAFATAEILDGHLKLVGPPTTFEGLRHGVLYYYLYAPFYWLGRGDPTLAAAFLRVVNALSVILIFAIGAVLFNKYVGFISAWLFAISFEQTQFALYFNHPSFAVTSILLLFLGLGLLIFRKKDYGIIIALMGLGLSIQFEFLLTYLIIPFSLILVVFRKSIPALSVKIKLLGLLGFFLTLLSFIITEIKFGFRSFTFLPQLLLGGSERSLWKIINFYLFEMGQVIKFNLTGSSNLKNIIGIFLIISLIIALKSKVKKQMIFLSLWFFSVIIIYFISGGRNLNVDIIQYHPNVGISLSLIIFTSYRLYLLGKKNYLFSIIIIILISFFNFFLIQKINPSGSMPEINAQSGMLLSDQKKVLDYIYHLAENKSFAVKAITMPYIINTTWSYLFSWYGKDQYGYLPVWGGQNAAGYPNNLVVETAQDKLPETRFLIIEPIRGIPPHLINNYIWEENYFSRILEEKKIGEFIVQKRIKI